MHYKINSQRKHILYEKQPHIPWLVSTMCYYPSSPISYGIVIKEMSKEGICCCTWVNGPLILSSEIIQESSVGMIHEDSIVVSI